MKKVVAIAVVLAALIGTAEAEDICAPQISDVDVSDLVLTEKYAQSCLCLKQQIFKQSSTAGNIRILEGGQLLLYAPLTVNSIQGDVICDGRSNIKNGKVLLTINGNLEESNVNFVLERNHY